MSWNSKTSWKCPGILKCPTGLPTVHKFTRQFCKNLTQNDLFVKIHKNIRMSVKMRKYPQSFRSKTKQEISVFVIPFIFYLACWPAMLVYCLSTAYTYDVVVIIRPVVELSKGEVGGLSKVFYQLDLYFY